jgi:hypothetical protein
MFTEQLLVAVLLVKASISVLKIERVIPLFTSHEAEVCNALGCQGPG